jgi:hypothetical protein
MQKRCLEAIPEEDEATGSGCQKIEAEDVSPAQGALGNGLFEEVEQLGREGRRDTDPDTDERLREVFERLNLTPEYELLIMSPASSEDEEATPVFKTALLSPTTPKPAPPSPLGVATGPPLSALDRWKKILQTHNTNVYSRQKLWRRRRRRSSLKKKKLE